MRLFNRKHNRLYSENEISNLFTKGSSHFIYPLKTMFLFSKGDQSDYKVLVTVSKKNLRRAVQRNIVKRRIKEAFRINCLPLKAAIEGRGIIVSIAFVYISKNIISYNEIEEQVKKQIKYLYNTIEKIEK